MQLSSRFGSPLRIRRRHGYIYGQIAYHVSELAAELAIKTVRDWLAAFEFAGVRTCRKVLVSPDATDARQNLSIECVAFDVGW